MQNNQDQEICFLPGWMYGADNYGFVDKVRLWQTLFNKIQPVSAKTLIGYSLGCNVALKWFLDGKSEKLILINPPVKAHSFAGLALSHSRFLFEASVQRRIDWSKTLSFKYLPVAIVSGLKIFNLNFWRMIEKCPPEKVSIVFGAEDNFHSSQKAKEILRQKGFNVIEVPDAGHNWTPRMSEEVQKLLN